MLRARRGSGKTQRGEVATWKAHSTPAVDGPGIALRNGELCSCNSYDRALANHRVLKVPFLLCRHAPPFN